MSIIENIEGSLYQNLEIHQQTVKNIANINSDNYIKSFPDSLSAAEKALQQKAAIDDEMRNLKTLKIESLMRLWTLKYQDMRRIVSLGKG